MASDELNGRERQVLEAVIRSYVETAEPAGSRTISRRFGLGVSPATIRNTMYEKGGREDLASIERGEVELLGKYLPAAVDPDVIRAAVVAAIDAGATNVGAVMGKVMAQFKGKAEGGTINGIVREELAKRA